MDTHPVHFHLFEVQLLNRVGWDGFIRLPDPNELGWKDTVRISPLEDTIVAPAVRANLAYDPQDTEQYSALGCDATARLDARIRWR